MHDYGKKIVILQRFSIIRQKKIQYKDEFHKNFEVTIR